MLCSSRLGPFLGLFLGLFLALALLGSAALPGAAHAQWSATPWSGIRAIERTDPGPVRVRAFEVDLCSPGMTVRATRPAEANQTLSSWASRVDVQAAVNANMWHCGVLCGVGIGNGERFAAADDNHWGYIAFATESAEYPWDYDTIAPAPWVEQAVGGHPRVVNGGAPIPAFAGNCLERHPRTSAGFNADRSKLILAVVDGRSSSSRGMTCAELATLMVSLGAHDALNLDGGGSSTAWRADRGVLNVPSDGRQRVVRNHLGIRSYGEGAPRHCSNHGPLPVAEAVARPLDSTTSEAWGFSLLDLRAWPGEYIGVYPRGPAVPAPRLVRAVGEDAVYLVDGGFKRHVPNPRALFGFHLHDNPIEALGAPEVAAFPVGPPLTQYPFIVVSPAPAHEAFLIDYRLPEVPPAVEDAGVGTMDDGGVSTPDAGAPSDAAAVADAETPPIDDAGRRVDAPATSDASGGGAVTGGCSVSSDAPGVGWALALFALLLSRVRHQRIRRR